METGDRFQFLDEPGGGLILELDRGLVLVAADDGREMWVDQRSILPEIGFPASDTGYSEEERTSSVTEWETGSRVSYLNDIGGGVIKAQSDGGFWVLDDDGFERWLSKAELVLVSGDIVRELSESETVNKDSPRKVYEPRPVEKTILEVDLHIHELLEFDSHLSDHEKLEHQIRVARHQLAEARRKNYKKVVLIHGVGKGVLKEKIREMLDGMERLEYYDASLQKYGVGATEVVLR